MFCRPPFIHVFLCYFCALLFFLFFDRKRWKNLFSCQNKWFRPANRVRSTRSLVEIHNNHKTTRLPWSIKVPGELELKWTLLFVTLNEGYSLDQMNMTEIGEHDQNRWTWPKSWQQRTWIGEYDRKSNIFNFRSNSPGLCSSLWGYLCHGKFQTSMRIIRWFNFTLNLLSSIRSLWYHSSRSHYNSF